MILYPHEFGMLQQFIFTINFDIEKLYEYGIPSERIDSIKVMDYCAETRKVHAIVTINGINILPETCITHADSVTNYARTKTNEKSIQLSYVLDFDEYKNK